MNRQTFSTNTCEEKAATRTTVHFRVWRKEYLQHSKGVTYSVVIQSTSSFKVSTYKCNNQWTWCFLAAWSLLIPNVTACMSSRGLFPNLKPSMGVVLLVKESPNIAYRIVDSAVPEDKLAIIQERLDAGVVIEMVPWHLALDAGKIHRLVDDLVVVGHLQQITWKMVTTCWTVWIVSIIQWCAHNACWHSYFFCVWVCGGGGGRIH